MPLSLKDQLRYGENPHQKAAVYVDKSLSEVNAGGIATVIQHHGKVRILMFITLADSQILFSVHLNTG